MFLIKILDGLCKRRRKSSLCQQPSLCYGHKMSRKRVQIFYIAATLFLATVIPLTASVSTILSLAAWPTRMSGAANVLK